MSHERLEVDLARDRAALERALRRVGGDDDLVLRLRRGEVGVGRLGQRVEQREVRQRREQAAGHDDRLPADPVGQRAEDDEERRAEQQRGADHQLRRRRVDLELRGQEEHARRTGPCTRRRPGRRSGRAAPAARSCRSSSWRTLGERRLRRLALFLHRLKAGVSFSCSRIHTRDDQQQERQQERHAPAPGVEGVVARRCTGRPMMTISERNRPSVAVVWIHDVYAPRLPCGACSAT